jgi:hypothetical protein
MRVLITQQFNSAMQNLNEHSKIETSTLVSFLALSDKEHILASAFTKIISINNDIFTLRGRTVRIFCTFSSQPDEDLIVLLDVKTIQDIGPIISNKDLEKETTLFGSRGEPTAYIENNHEKTIFSFNGEPLAYIDEKNSIYGFNGKHLGWFEDHIIWDHSGKKVGFTKSSSPTFTKFEPFKGFKQFKPFKSFKQYEPHKPLKRSMVSDIGLLEFLKDGRS